MKNKKYIYVLLIIISGVILFYPALNNDFVNWDDDVYILNNPDITSFSNIDKFFTNYYIGHYHPLTMISYAIDYAVSGYDPFIYHIHNVLLHIISSILIFYIVLLLLKNNVSAFITALLFLIHPLRVESVAWIAERKDVLYTVFYFASVLLYVLSKQSNEKPQKKRLLFLAIIFFILSLLSKTAAVSLPLVLIMIDIYLGVKIKKAIITKIPLLLFSAIVGFFTLYVLGHEKAIYDISNNYTLLDRIFMTFYALSFYIVRLFYPFNLSASYFFVEKTNGFLPVTYYLSVVLIFAIILFVIKSKILKKELVFGFLVYLFTIFMFLQIIPSGRVLVADRYSYVPYFGLFFIIAAVYKYLESKKQYLRLYTILLSLIILISLYSTNKRIKVWKNGVSLFTDIIEDYPNNPLGYVNRGLAYYYGFSENHKIDYYKSIEDFNKAISIDHNNIKAVFNRGNSYYMIGDLNNALNDFNKTIELDSTYAKAYNNRGLVYSRLVNDKMALEDFNKAILLVPDYSEAYYNRGITYYNTGNLVKACEDWNKAKSLKYLEAENFILKYCN
ncbi:MAG: tetratricopeptide repeat protein [Marinilabiliales bacterium]